MLTAQEITTLRFATDAVAHAAPSDWVTTLRQLACVPELPANTRGALTLIENALNAQTETEPGLRLVRAAESLITSGSTNCIVGAALYSSLLSQRGLRYAIRDFLRAALNEAQTSALLEQYRRAGLDGNFEPYRR